jgi:uncharacterized SAM-binding protein YcdF (DUF218 family)
VSLLKLVFLPSKLIFLLLLVALICFVIRRWRRLAHIPFILASILYIVMSSGTVSTLLLSPLEYKYAALHKPEDYPDIKQIVVLTAYVANDPLMPLSGKFNANTIFRIVEAHNIYKRCNDCRVIISGTPEDVGLIHQQFVVLGIPETSIEDDPIDGHTIDSAISLASKLEDKKLFLVSSAGHMTRAVGVFEKHGLQPVAAPTDYLLPEDFTHASIMPDSLHLYYSDLAVNEYAGILWYRLTDRM